MILKNKYWLDQITVTLYQWNIYSLLIFESENFKMFPFYLNNQDFTGLVVGKVTTNWFQISILMFNVGNCEFIVSTYQPAPSIRARRQMWSLGVSWNPRPSLLPVRRGTRVSRSHRDSSQPLNFYKINFWLLWISSILFYKSFHV